MKQFGRILGWMSLSLAFLAMTALAGAEVKKKSVSLSLVHKTAPAAVPVVAPAPAEDPYLGFKPETDPNKKPLDMYSAQTSRLGKSNPIVSESLQRFNEASAATMQYQMSAPRR